MREWDVWVTLPNGDSLLLGHIEAESAQAALDKLVSVGIWSPQIYVTE